jgi:phosphopentomutase
MGRRAVVVVLDACGAGALPDAAEYGDADANTLGHVARAAGGLDVPTLGALGLGSILALAGVPPAAEPVLHGRLHPLGPGKDTTAGHWELMGVVAPAPPPTYPAGFPAEVIEALRAAWGRGVLCNAPYSGIEVIDDFGAEHVRTGHLIVYTSQDSVMQVAAHEDVVPREELYAACEAARAVMHGEHAVGRVIARPFTGPPGAFARTDGRRDLALAPPARSYLDELSQAGLPVHAVGKVAQVFAHRGIDEEHPAPDNARGIAATTALLGALEAGLVFTNLVETDQVYGHRNDVTGFHSALREIDGAVARWLELIGEEDLLVLTADHGCDPTLPGSDHTREHAPLLARFAGHGGRRHDGPLADVGASALRWLTGRDAPVLPGTAFVA